MTTTVVSRRCTREGCGGNVIRDHYGEAVCLLCARSALPPAETLPWYRSQAAKRAGPPEEPNAPTRVSTQTHKDLAARAELVAYVTSHAGMKTADLAKAFDIDTKAMHGRLTTAEKKGQLTKVGVGWITDPYRWYVAIEEEKAG